MEELIEKFRRKLGIVKTDFVRSLGAEINWNARLVGIKGARGVGKTTLLLQHIKQSGAAHIDISLYVSLDSIWFSRNSLLELADTFMKRGGRFLYLDEVHKYPNWSQELKNIYDDYPELHIIFTGSSLLEILNARADLSRRAVVYTLQGLSLREFICLETGLEFEKYTLSQLILGHEQISADVVKQISPIKYFDLYLKHGYYPFYREELSLYCTKLEAVISMMLEIELPLLRGMDLGYVNKIKQLLLIMAESVPFTPNIVKLSEKIGVSRGTMLLYFQYLNEVALSINLYKDANGVSKLQKPTKVYLDNTNLMYALSPNSVNVGSRRETFFANQLSYGHKIEYAERGDFLVDGAYIFEVGGKDKTLKQIGVSSSNFIAADNIEFGYQQKIPLWLFGFLY